MEVEYLAEHARVDRNEGGEEEEGEFGNVDCGGSFRQ